MLDAETARLVWFGCVGHPIPEPDSTAPAGHVFPRARLRRSTTACSVRARAGWGRRRVYHPVLRQRCANCARDDIPASAHTPYVAPMRKPHPLDRTGTILPGLQPGRAPNGGTWTARARGSGRIIYSNVYSLGMGCGRRAGYIVPRAVRAALFEHGMIYGRPPSPLTG